jgi:tRNA dimethylallyltransferase
VVAIVGTNASGKSELAIELAERFDGEIVSADSRQVFRGLDLCSGKVPPEARQRVLHHGVDVVDIGAEFSVSDYQALAYTAIEATLARSRLPVIVGGTGLYVHAVTRGYVLADVPPDHQFRSEAESMSLNELVERLRQLNPAAVEEVDIQNPRRVIRAIELAAAGQWPATRQMPRYSSLHLGLTWPAPVLKQRIEDRLRRRLAQGMIDEVAQARERGVADEALYQLGLEYRYILRFLIGELSREELVTELHRAIYRFARRQMTWFRADPEIHWLDTNEPLVPQALALTEAFLVDAANPTGGLQPR